MSLARDTAFGSAIRRFVAHHAQGFVFGSHRFDGVFRGFSDSDVPVAADRAEFAWVRLGVQGLGVIRRPEALGAFRPDIPAQY